MNEEDKWSEQARKYKENDPGYGDTSSACVLEAYISMYRTHEEPLDALQAFMGYVYSEEMAYIRRNTRGE